MHIVMIATENDALPGGKVGGLGDVIRDLPIALAKAGHKVSVITPGYGIFTASETAEAITELTVEFCAQTELLSAYRVFAPVKVSGVDYWALEHPLFSIAGPGKIYIDDDDGPFATDAHRFALFSAATAHLLQSAYFPDVDLIHCHDWHTGMLLVLRQFAPEFKALKQKPVVFSIHNLSLQGVRPLSGQLSSLHAWFPDIQVEYEKLTDPVHHDCINLMRCGINLADKVHTVSPCYALEILRPSDWVQGRVGGEGLEEDLSVVHNDGRLIGILNGCDYEKPIPRKLSQRTLWQRIESNLDNWATRSGAPCRSYYFALSKLNQWRNKRNALNPMLVSIGRLTPQKLYLLVQQRNNSTVMELLLQRLHPGIFVMLGSGDAYYDEFFTAIMQSHPNFLYLSGYSDELSTALYGSGDLFVMPSVYEPCGISQMLAMRAGVPCLVHEVGGLRDTVQDRINGFSFGGENLNDKLDNLFTSLDTALQMYDNRPDEWKKIRRAARASRFHWQESVKHYQNELYRFSQDMPEKGA